MSENNAELGFQLQLENIAAEPAFEEVLEVAIETCLRDASIYELALKSIQETDSQNQSPEQLVTNQLGGWGLRAMVDYSNYSAAFYEEPDDNLPPPLMKHVIEDPETIPLRPNKLVQQKIEAFGKALIDEAFECLGPDAIQKVDEFKNAKEETTQHAILMWLYYRIADICDNPEIQKRKAAEQNVSDLAKSIEQTVVEGENWYIKLGPAEPIDPNRVLGEPIIVDLRIDASEVELLEDVKPEDEILDPVVEQTAIEAERDQLFYHPARLSPKFIGSYPETRVTPTCLGISLLAAAFFEKAGAPYMHAGVMETSLEYTRMNQNDAILHIDSLAQEHNTSLNNTAASTFSDMLKTIEILRRNDRGHHVRVLVQLVNGRWAGIDPNYRALDGYLPTDNKTIQKRFELLEQISQADKGAATICDGREGMFSTAYYLPIVEIAPLPAEEVALRLDWIMSGETIEEDLKTYLLSTFADEGDLNFGADVITKLTTGDKLDYTDNLLGEILQKYVYNEMPLDAFVQRYKTDPAFRERRIQDFQMAPHLLMMKMLGQFASLQSKDAFYAPPASLELGLPHFRIGACVLSDFAVYTGDEMPLSFWAANWSSHVAIEDHLPPKNDGSTQAQLARRMSSIIRSGILRHFTSYGIIRRFLEQGEKQIDREGIAGTAD